MWSLTVWALFVAGFSLVAVLAAADRFYRFEAVPLFAVPVCWTAGAVLYTALAPWLSRVRTWLWVSLAAVLMLLTTFVWPLGMLAQAWAGERRIEATEVSPNGRHEAVAEWFPSMIDPSCRVLLRERGGPLSRQLEIWERIDAPCPERIEFVGTGGVRITERQVPGRDPVEPITVTFDPDTMTTDRITEGT